MNAKQPTAIFQHFETKVKCFGSRYTGTVKTIKDEVPYSKLYSEVLEEKKLLSRSLAQISDNKRNVVIGLVMTNGITYIKTVLTCSASGCVFLPIPSDTTPIERLSYCAKDASVDLLMTSKDDRKGIDKIRRATGSQTPLITTDTIVGYVYDDPGKMGSTLDPEVDYCYLMYTSGSTGKPKCVAITNANVANLSESQLKAWEVGRDDTILQSASIGFDASISEICMGLIGGASLAIPTPQDRKGKELLAAIDRMKASLMIITPSVLCLYKPSSMPSCIKTIISGGEACDIALADAWYENGKRKFFNGYGPTECTVCATSFKYDPAICERMPSTAPLPIGPPIDGVRIVVASMATNEDLRIATEGTIGELLVGGKSVAAGYVGAALDQTKDKFICVGSDRWYKTGDFVRQARDPRLVTFHGREDDQVKVKGGIRVDLNEVEYEIRKIVDQNQVAVVNHKCKLCTVNKIVAYIHSPSSDNERGDDNELSETSINAKLAGVLPEFAIPQRIVFTDRELPTTTNGKMNKKSLKDDEEIHRVSNMPEVDANFNDDEAKLAEVWKAVLGTAPCHPSLSFNQMGGESMHLIPLQWSIEAEFGVPISIGALTEAVHQPLKEMVRVVKGNSFKNGQLRQKMLDDSVFRFSDVNSTGPLPQTLRYVPAAEKPDKVFLTGCTGFLGAYVLSELIQSDLKVIVYCLVRGEGGATALISRISDNMDYYGLISNKVSDAFIRGRIRVVSGSLDLPNLGIKDNKVMRELEEDVDVIIDNGAAINLTKCYGWHRDANVQSTKSLLKLALSCKRKFYYKISSLVVKLFTPLPVQDVSTLDIADPLDVNGGYARSKWVSDKMAQAALASLPGGFIYRPSRLFSAIHGSGKLPNNDLMYLLYTGMKSMGSHPDISTKMIDLVPVDVCAAIVARDVLSSGVERRPKTHLVTICNESPMAFNDLFESSGLSPMPLGEWRAQLMADAQGRNPSNPLLPLAGFLMSEFWDKVVGGYWPQKFTNSNSVEMLSVPESFELWKKSRASF